VDILRQAGHDRLGRLIKLIIEIFKGRVLLGVIRSGASSEWVIRAAEGAHSRTTGAAGVPAVEVTPQTSQNTVMLIKQTGDLLKVVTDLLFDEELVLWVTAMGQRDVNKDVLRTCEMAEEAAAFAIIKAQRKGLHVPDSILNDAASGTRDWSWLAARLIHCVPNAKRHDLPPATKKDLEERERRANDVIYRLIDIGYGWQWDRRCSGPNCLKTWMDLGRRFWVCSGCRNAHYCSRRCQKQGWKHPKASHRNLCDVSRRVQIALERRGSQKSTHATVRAFVSVREAEDAYLNIKTLRAAKFAHLRESIVWASTLRHSCCNKSVRVSPQ
jgi:hypothetical protein